MAVLAVFLFSGSQVGAQVGAEVGLETVREQAGFANTDLITIIGKIIQIVLSFLGLIALIIIIYAGVIWMTSRGNAEKIDRAKKMMIAGLIGLLIILSAFAIVTFVIRLLTGEGRVFGGGGESCSEGAISNCSRCVAGGWQCDSTLEGCSNSCGDGEDSFFYLKFTTPNNGETNIKLCSIAQAVFNLAVDPATIQQGTNSVSVEDYKLRLRLAGADKKQENSECKESKECRSGRCVVRSGTKICEGKYVSGVLTTLNSKNEPTSAVTFDPDTDYFEATTYEAIITTGTSGIKSVSGLSLAGGDRTWTFTTGNETDKDPPKVEKVFPKDNSTDVCLLSLIQAQFNEAMDVRTLTDSKSIRLLSADSEANIPKLSQTAADSKTLTAEPQSLLREKTAYQPFLDSGIIADACGNRLDGNANGKAEGSPTDNYPPLPLDKDPNWSFTTGINAYCRPEITKIEPSVGYYANSQQNQSDEVTITGAYFALGGDVIFNNHNIINNGDGAKCFDENFFPDKPCIKDWDNTEIKLLIPAIGGASNGAISGPVYVVAGTVWSNPLDFTLGSPHISWISPENGPPGQYVTISGINFGDSKGWVYWVKKADAGQIDSWPAEFPCVNSWQDNRIIIKVNETVPLANGAYYIQIKRADDLRRSNIKYFGVDKALKAGPGLCSVANQSDLEKRACGQVGNVVNFIGERFDGTTQQTLFGETQGVNSRDWTQTTVTADIPVGINPGHFQVSVQIDGQESNKLPFSSPCGLGDPCDSNITTSACDPYGACPSGQYCGSSCSCLPGVKVLESAVCNSPNSPSPNPQNKSQDACVNSVISAAFDRELDVSSFAGKLKVFQCNTGATYIPTGCSALSGTVKPLASETTGAESTGAGSDRIWFEPDLTLAQNTWYKAVIKGGDTGVKDVNSRLMLTDYEWHFKTRNTDVCPLSNISIGPPSATITGAGKTQSFTATPTLENCNLSHGDYKYSWESTNLSVATVAAGETNTNKATATGLNLGVAQIKATAERKTGTAQLFVNACSGGADADARCQDGYTQDNSKECSASVCDLDKKACTPSLNSLTPASGASGTWTTIRGCYFGSREGGVKFTNQSGNWVDGVKPSSTQSACDSTWQDKEIIAEIPAGIANVGKAKVVTTQGLESNDDKVFTVNDQIYPGLCKLNPNFGLAGNEVAVIGNNFGDAQGNVTFANDKTATVSTWGNLEIKVAVPAGAQTGDVKVTRNNPSNALEFTTLVAPRVISKSPADDSKVCTNIAVSIVFSQLMAETSFVDNFKLEKYYFDSVTGNNVYESVSGSFSFAIVPNQKDSCANPSGCTKAMFIPDKILDFSAAYQITLGQGLTNENAVNLDSQDIGSTWNFTTSNSICRLDQVSLSPQRPQRHLFVRKDETQQFTASAYEAGGQVIFSNDVYAFDWFWSSSDNSVAVINPDDPAQTAVATAQNKNGKATITAKAQVTGGSSLEARADKDRSRSGQAPVEVFLCEVPWSSGVYQETSTNFKLNYCRGRIGAALLPDLKVVTVQIKTQARGLIKDLLFANPNGQDSIGLQVYQNLEHLSLADWYRSRGLTGSLASINPIDGYPAAQLGRTTYIGAANIGADNKIYSNIYLISYSDNASAELIEIYKQMLDSLEFNINFGNSALVKLKNVNSCEYSGGFCTKDFDCPLVENLCQSTHTCANDNNIACGNNYECNTCLSAKDKLQRDIKRYGDFNVIAQALENYKTKTGSYPRLAAGTYISGITTTKWPSSWQQPFGQELGLSLPVDPINEFTACPAGYEPQTCWNKTLKAFFCPVGSHIYKYRISGQSYVLESDFEFKYPDITWATPIAESSFVSHFNTTEVCGGSISGQSAACGDQIKGPGEVCEIGEYRNYCDNIPSSNNQNWHNETFQYCQDSGDKACREWKNVSNWDCVGYCGDASKNGPEDCDKNSSVTNSARGPTTSYHNQYTCGSDCQWSAGGWCQDGIQQTGYENCDKNDYQRTLCEGTAAGQKYQGIQFASCKTDCSGYNPPGNCLPLNYCGDGKTGQCQSGVSVDLSCSADNQCSDSDCGFLKCQNGADNGKFCSIDANCLEGQCLPIEQCDDGANINGDGCSNVCKFEVFNFVSAVPDNLSLYMALEESFNYDANVSTEAVNPNIKYALKVTPQSTWQAEKPAAPGVEAHTFTITPEGSWLKIDSDTGVVSGTPINSFYQAGDFQIEIIAYDNKYGLPTDASNPMTKVQIFTLKVLPDFSLMGYCGDGKIYVCAAGIKKNLICDPLVEGQCPDSSCAAVETCDDSNAAAGDGCSAICKVETGYSCKGLPSVCQEAYLISGRTVDALEAKGLSNAKLELIDANDNNNSVAVVNSDTAGNFSFTDVSPGNYKIRASKEEDSTKFVAVTTAPFNVNSNVAGIDIQMGPADIYAFVLTWDEPLDLDFHIKTSINCFLEPDNTTPQNCSMKLKPALGNKGQETGIITALVSDASYIFYVHSAFGDKFTSGRVRIYGPNWSLLYDLAVSRAGGNEDDDYWIAAQAIAKGGSLVFKEIQKLIQEEPPFPLPLLTCGDSTKTQSGCTSAGGEVVTVSDDSQCTLCRFNTSSCPEGGWSQYLNYSTEISGSQDGQGWNAFTCSYTLKDCFGHKPSDLSFSAQNNFTIRSRSHIWGNIQSVDRRCCVGFIGSCYSYRNAYFCDDPLSYSYSTRSYEGRNEVCTDTTVQYDSVIYVQANNGSNYFLGAGLAAYERPYCAYPTTTQIGCK